MLVYANIFFINIVIIYFGFCLVWFFGWLIWIKSFPFRFNFFDAFKILNLEFLKKFVNL